MSFRPIKEELSKNILSRATLTAKLFFPYMKNTGTEMFKKLDAEFAMVIYDGKKDSYIAARDPIGIRPLFYRLS